MQEAHRRSNYQAQARLPPDPGRLRAGDGARQLAGADGSRPPCTTGRCGRQPLNPRGPQAQPPGGIHGRGSSLSRQLWSGDRGCVVVGSHFDQELRACSDPRRSFHHAPRARSGRGTRTGRRDLTVSATWLRSGAAGAATCWRTLLSDAAGRFGALDLDERCRHLRRADRFGGVCGQSV